MSFRTVLLLFGLLSLRSHADFNASLKASYRNAPSGQNLQATLAYDRLLWGEVEKEKALYGYYRAGVIIGGTPTAAGFVEVSPWAPLVFRAQKGATYRYLDSSVFDCSQSYCFGVVDRTDLSATLVGAYKSWLGLVSYLWRDIKMPLSSLPVVAEQEYFLLNSGAHNYGEWTAALGYKLEEQKTIGLQYMSGEVSQFNRRAQSIYLVYQWEWHDINFTAGAGHFDSDETRARGTGVIFLLSKSFGDSLSLF